MRPHDEIERLREERDQLQTWKDSALAVEREWDPQALAKLLGIPLGKSIRRELMQRIPALVKQAADASEDTHRVAVLEHTKANVDYYIDGELSPVGYGDGHMWLVGSCGGKTLREAIDALREMLREEAQDSQ